MKENREKAINFLLDDEGSEMRYDRPRAMRLGLSWPDVPVGAILGDITRDAAFELHARKWDRERVSSFPSGLDYFLFDSYVCCDRDVVFRWLRSIVDFDTSKRDYESLVETCYYFSSERVRLVIDQLELFRRRKHRVDPGWQTHAQAWTNRVSRVKRRAQALIEEPALADA